MQLMLLILSALEQKKISEETMISNYYVALRVSLEIKS